MEKILATYFKSKSLDAFILISYKLSEEYETVKLIEINFFKNENDVNNFIERANLKLFADSHNSTSKKIKALKDLINNYLSGGKFNLFDEIKELNIELDLQDKFPTSFSQDVIKNLVNLKYGEITTYSKIGNEIGSKAYRAIGNVCKSNPVPLIIPCHRVVRKNGEIGGFMGKLDKTWETKLKRQLLEIEGYKI